MLLGIVFIASGLIFTSCRDEENALINKSEDILNKQEVLCNNYQLSNFSLADANTTVEMNDYLLAQIGQSHNYYLENIIKDFDFNANNYEQELQNRILNVSISIDKFPMNYRNKFAEKLSMSTKHIKSGNKLMSDNNDAMIMTLEDAIKAINATNLSDKNVLIKYITDITNYLTAEDNIDHHSVFCSKLDAYKKDAINNPRLNDTSVMVVKAFVELLKASAEFWYPVEYGGNGKGAEFLKSISSTQELNNKSKSDRFQKEAPKPPGLSDGQAALAADGLAVASGFLGLAIGTALAPITAGVSLAGAVAAMAAETAFASGTAALMNGGGSTGAGGSNGLPGGGNGNGGNGGNGGGNGGNGNGNGNGGKGGGGGKK